MIKEQQVGLTCRIVILNLITVDIFTPRCDAFAFLRLSVGDTEGSVVNFNAPDPSPIGRDGGLYQVNVTIPFEVEYNTSTYNS